MALEQFSVIDGEKRTNFYTLADFITYRRGCQVSGVRADGGQNVRSVSCAAIPPQRRTDQPQGASETLQGRGAGSGVQGYLELPALVACGEAKRRAASVYGRGPVRGI